MLTFGLKLGKASFAAGSLTSFNPSAMSYDSDKSLDVSAQDGSVSGVQLNDNGTQILISGVISDDIFRYDGSTYMDLSSAVVNGGVTDTLSGNPTGLLYNDDGTRMFVFQSSVAIEGYDCVAYTPSTNVYNAGYQLSISATGITFGRGFCFNSDGTKLLVVGFGTQTIHYYDLSVAYNPGSGVRDMGKELDFSPVIGGAGDMSCVRWLQNDSVIQVSDLASDMIYSIALVTAGDPSTGVHDVAKSLDTSVADNMVTGFEWSADGRNLYLAGQEFDTIHFFESV